MPILNLKLITKIAHKILFLFTLLSVITILYYNFSYFGKYNPSNNRVWEIYTLPVQQDFIKTPKFFKRHPDFNKYPSVPEIHMNIGYLKYNLGHADYLAKFILFTLTNLLMVSIFFILFLLMKILASIDDKLAFNSTNIRRINIIALLLGSISLIQFLNTLFNHWYIMKTIELKEHVFVTKLFFLSVPSKFSQPQNQILLSNQYSIMPIIAALMIFAVAYAFRQGLELKNDNDSIL